MNIITEYLTNVSQGVKMVLTKLDGEKRGITQFIRSNTRSFNKLYFIVVEILEIYHDNLVGTATCLPPFSSY